MKLIIIYLLLINAVSFALMLIDKYKAKKNLWRISEATLMCFAVFGGSLGALFGMQLAKHKTRHLKFQLGIPLIFFFAYNSISYFLSNIVKTGAMHRFFILLKVLRHT